MMRLLLSLFAFVVLAACAATIPDDGAVGAGPKQPAAVTAPAAKKAADAKTDSRTVSNTQNFNFVTERISAAADKAHLKVLSKEYTVVAPTALPKRGDRVSVAEYAFRTTNVLGKKRYKRRNPFRTLLAKANCRRYILPDDAQQAFLEAGGPERDPLNLDPDGDGFACSWTPNQYRKLLK